MKKIVITGGHLTPALAVIERLPKKDWDIIFIGRKYALEGEKTLSVEYKTTRKLGIPFISITAGRVQRSLTRYTLISLLKVPIGLIQSFYWLNKLKPKVILSFGSYVALPVALAGWVLRIPVVTHEQSVVSGLATKIIARFARKVCVSWPQTKEDFPEDKTVLTGNPIRKEIIKKYQVSNIKYQISDEKLPLIYITGGNLGAHAINEIVSQILPKLLEKYRIIHQCGESETYRDFENLSSIIYHLSPDLRKRCFLTKYVGPEDIGWVLNSADLVISRAGANTVTELAVLGKPAILIPLPWVGQNEQMENARILENMRTAIILPQEKLTSQTLFQHILILIKNIDDYQANAQKAKQLVDSGAVDNLVKVVSEVTDEELLEEKSA